MARNNGPTQNSKNFQLAMHKAVTYLSDLYKDEQTAIDEKTSKYMIPTNYYLNPQTKGHFVIMIQRHIEGFQSYLQESDEEAMDMKIRYRSMEFRACIDNPRRPLLRISASSQINHAANGTMLPVILERFEWNVRIDYSRKTVRSAVRNIVLAMFVYFHKVVLPPLRRVVPAGPRQPTLYNPSNPTATDDPHPLPEIVTIENNDDTYEIELDPVITVPIPEEPDFSSEGEQPQDTIPEMDSKMLTKKLHIILDRLLKIHC
jgi:hypothetical protein